MGSHSWEAKPRQKTQHIYIHSVFQPLCYAFLVKYLLCGWIWMSNERISWLTVGELLVFSQTAHIIFIYSLFFFKATPCYATQTRLLYQCELCTLPLNCCSLSCTTQILHICLTELWERKLYCWSDFSSPLSLETIQGYSLGHICPSYLAINSKHRTL